MTDQLHTKIVDSPLFPDGEEGEAAVIKRGETCLITTFSRTALGLGIRVKAHAAVELFMRGLAEPDAPPIEVSVVDRYWVPTSTKNPLLAYRISQALPSMVQPSGYPLFTLDRLGRPLLDDREADGPSNARDTPVNLSYLRLIGISEGAGVTFNLKGVYSLEELRKMEERVAHAQQQFYINYIRPVNLSVIISTQEVQF